MNPSATPTSNGPNTFDVPLGGDELCLDTTPPIRGRRVTSRFIYLGDLSDTVLLRMCALFTRHLWMTYLPWVYQGAWPAIGEDLKRIDRITMFRVLNARSLGEWIEAVKPFHVD